MKFFIDTANLNEIKKAYDLGISGVTTNPSLVVKEGRDFKELIKEISKIVIDGPISAEVISLEAEEMVKEAEEFCKISDNIVIKIPMCEEGLKAVKILNERQIDTNVTLIFSATQALLAARAGATYVSPFVGRLDDIGFDGISLIEDISHIFRSHRIQTEIIAASMRNIIHVKDAAEAGADIATIPYNIITSMINHPLTEKGIQQFLSDWHNANQK
ncbi:MAG: fructose-6-phosphate aldolase [Oscillospiraceae bacterium]